MVVSEDQTNPVPSVEKPVVARPGFGIWIATYLLTMLITGAFFMTGLFITYGFSKSGDVLPLIMMGVIPGLVCGAVSVGFVYAIYPPHRWYAAAMALFLVMIPMQLVGLIVPPDGSSPSFAPLLISPIALLMAAIAIPIVVNVYRRSGKGAVKVTKGSWEEHF